MRKMWHLWLTAALLPLLWFPYAAVRQVSASSSSYANCDDDGLGGWRLLLRSYADQHGGELPGPSERERLAQRASHGLTCNLGSGYEWDDAQSRVTSSENARILAICARPHGFTHRWRNVLLTDLTLRRCPYPSSPLPDWEPGRGSSTSFE